ncbi:glycosyltransferase [Reinekea sp.]|jgi:glycosyltransferase involved in cell wall biosynthesis|uniref:glycosyltransferase n=1 Tax=Reinekea sp. TaxID=1970455 RepID=UPI002A7FC960|nr:glycosyltransferase [Reinekea sp.]
MRPDKKYLLSFIVPCKNEIANIGRLIASIDQNLPRHTYEIIVVDNGSTDGTIEYLLALQDRKLFVCPELPTVAALRNFGYEKSNSELLVFLDADVELGAHWYQTLIKFRVMGCFEATVSGSHVLEPKSACFPIGWYDGGRQHMNGTHINTAHLIVNRKTFADIGGFDSTMVSGEDFEFSTRAVKKGYQVVNYPELKVTHYGYPKTLSEFFQREMWHGAGDTQNIGSILSSKVAMVSLVFSGCLIAALLLLPLAPVPSIFLVLISSLICVLSAIVKYRANGLLEKAYYSLVFSIYFFARFLSILKRIAYVWR